MIKHLIAVAVLLLSACKPPATDEYIDRDGSAQNTELVGVPIESPDSTDAVWVETDRAGRIIYGVPGQTPLMALACAQRGGGAEIHITRFAAADPDAKALMALIGNGYTARLPIDAVWNGRVWLWEGYYPAANLNLDALTGPRKVEATIPGAGSVILNPSQRPARLIEACRQIASENSAPA